MKYAISILKSDTPTYKKERYSSFEEAQKAFGKIPKSEQTQYGIAELLDEAEIAEQTERLAKEQAQTEAMADAYAGRHQNIRDEQALAWIAEQERKKTEVTNVDIVGLHSGNDIMIDGVLFRRVASWE